MGFLSVEGQYSSEVVLPPRSSNVNVTVTAEDGVTQKACISSSVNRPIGHNPDLASLRINVAGMSPVFSANTTAYSVSVLNYVSTITVLPVSAQRTP